MKCPECSRYARWDATLGGFYCDNCERQTAPQRQPKPPTKPSPPIGRVLMEETRMTTVELTERQLEILNLACATTVTLMRSVDVPSDAPLYGAEDELEAVARHLDCKRRHQGSATR